MNANRILNSTSGTTEAGAVQSRGEKNALTRKIRNLVLAGTVIALTSTLVPNAHAAITPVPASIEQTQSQYMEQQAALRIVMAHNKLEKRFFDAYSAYEAALRDDLDAITVQDREQALQVAIGKQQSALQFEKPLLDANATVAVEKYLEQLYKLEFQIAQSSDYISLAQGGAMQSMHDISQTSVDVNVGLIQYQAAIRGEETENAREYK